MIKEFLIQRPNKGIVTTDHPKNWKACFSQLSRHKLLYSVINYYTLAWLVSGSAAHELRFTPQYVSITGTNFLLSHLISFLFSLRHRKYWISLTPPGHQGLVWPILRDPITLRYRKLLKKLASRTLHILRCMGSKFSVKFQRPLLTFHTKFWTQTSQKCIILTVIILCDLWYLGIVTS